MSTWGKIGRGAAAIYTGGLTEYARMAGDSGKGSRRRGAAYDQEMAQVADDQGHFKLDQYGYTPVEPGKHVAYQAQYASNAYIAARNAAIRADALHTLQSGLGNLEQYRPGGAAALASPYYSNMAQLLMNSQLEPPDLMGQVRKESQQNANRQARNAMYAQIGQGLLTVAGAAIGGPAGAAVGAGLGQAAGADFANGKGTAPIPQALNEPNTQQGFQFGQTQPGYFGQGSPGQAGPVGQGDPQAQAGGQQGWFPMQDIGQQASAEHLQNNPMGSGGEPAPSGGTFQPWQPMGQQQSAQHLQGNPMGGGGGGGPQASAQGGSQAQAGGGAGPGGMGGGGGIGQFFTMKAMAEVNGVDYYGALLHRADELQTQAEAILYAR